MPRPSLLPLAAALALLAPPALAQGTAAQRAACAPDAVALCPETIPDVPRTRACMAAHFSALSPGCRAEFAAATRPRRRRLARIPTRRYRHYAAGWHIPRFDPVEAEAEVHAVARYRPVPLWAAPYRTPYPYPGLFGPF